MKKMLPIALLMSALFAGSVDTSAQQKKLLGLKSYRATRNNGDNLKAWWKREVTIGVAQADPLTYTDRLRFTSPEASGSNQTEFVRTGTAISQPGLFVNVNANHLLAYLAPNTILSFSAGLEATALQSSFGTFYKNTVEIAERPLYRGQIGMPLTLDLKWGSDVDFNADVPACIAIGGGVMPAYARAIYGKYTGSTFYAAPYLYASVGFYAWGCWKVRASYIPSELPVIPGASSSDAAATHSLRVQGGNVMQLGISRMMRSHDWKAGGHGWRTGGRRNGGGATTRLF